MKQPQAKKENTVLTLHGDIRVDPYYWMKDREDPEVTAYVEQENEYCAEMMRDTDELQQKLFEEMKARYKEDDESLPYFFNEYWYIVRYEAGKEYPIFSRKHQNLENEEEILLDVNLLAAGQAFYEVGSVAVSPDNKLMSFSADNIGRRIYRIQFKNLETGEVLQDQIANTTGKVVWANDNRHVFYIRKDEQLRAFQVYMHELGTDSSLDVLVFHEEDEAFDVNVYKTKSLKYIFISSSSTNSDEHRFIPADHVLEPWTIIEPRAEHLEYAVEHYQDQFYIITNADGATNFKIVTAPVSSCRQQYWQDLIPHQEETLLESFEIFEDFLVLEERTEGLLHLKVIESKTGHSHYLEFTDPAYTAYIGLNLEFKTSKLRYGYTSLTQPGTTLEYDMETRHSHILKQQEVMSGDFSAENYISERIAAPSRDRKNKIYISLVYHKDTKKSAATPLLLYGYGSYGHTVDATFSHTRLSLLNRGFIYAIAHIRGGEYLGREWYETGRMLKKKNTFNDFIDVAKYLISEGYTSAKHLYGMGGSAGGLLVGAVANLAPELFHGIVAQVPFVDVVTTMLDESIPLTTGEFDEWGNPKFKTYYNYIKSYSPYDNVVAKEYPNILITTGFHDSQVQYWEPAKWTAKLRELKTDSNLLLFKTDMSSGHGGASGRFESLHEDALEFAFLLKLENKIDDK